jgi:hypothetical protein
MTSRILGYYHHGEEEHVSMAVNAAFRPAGLGSHALEGKGFGFPQGSQH